MTENKQTFEELVTEMGMDPAAVKTMVEHLQSANALDATWRAWCAPLIEQARRLESIVNKVPEYNTRANPHSLNRPGMYISVDGHGDNPHLNIRVPDVGGLSVQRERRDGVYLYSHLKRHDEKGNFCGSTEVYAHLERSWHQQSELLRNNWKELFGAAPAILDATERSLFNGTPLGSIQSWRLALTDHLAGQHKNEIDPSTWRIWTERWGDSTMVAALDVVDSLFDASNALVWRDQLVQAWKSLDAVPKSPLDNLDTTVFVNS